MTKPHDIKKDGHKRGRHRKPQDQKYRPVSIRLHPAAFSWLHKEAARLGVGYQTIINDILLASAIPPKPSGNS